MHYEDYIPLFLKIQLCSQHWHKCTHQPHPCRHHKKLFRKTEIVENCWPVQPEIFHLEIWDRWTFDKWEAGFPKFFQDLESQDREQSKASSLTAWRTPCQVGCPTASSIPAAEQQESQNSGIVGYPHPWLLGRLLKASICFQRNGKDSNQNRHMQMCFFLLDDLLQHSRSLVA